MDSLDLSSLIALEEAVWQALVNGDVPADERLLSHDFVGVYPSGFAGRDDHAGQLAAGPTVRSFALADARMLVVSESAVMLCYRATYERPGGDARPESMYVSSLWCRRDGRWVNVFSQDTPEGALDVV